MRVNEVIITRIEGAIDSTVSSAINWMARSVTPVPWPRLMLISCASAGSVSDPAAIRLTRNKTLRGRPADLTKAISDGPAAMPFRPRDFQSRPLWVAGRPAAPLHCAVAQAVSRAPPAARRPAARPARRPDGARRLRDAAPSRRGFDRPRKAPGRAGAGAPRHARG